MSSSRIASLSRNGSDIHACLLLTGGDDEVDIVDYVAAAAAAAAAADTYTYVMALTCCYLPCEFHCDLHLNLDDTDVDSVVAAVPCSYCD